MIGTRVSRKNDETTFMVRTNAGICSRKPDPQTPRPGALSLLLAVPALMISLGLWPNSVAYGQAHGPLPESTSLPVPAAPSATNVLPPPEPAPAVPTPPPPDEKKGGSGESCTKAADCRENFKCIQLTCVDPMLGVEGDSCTKVSECNANLRCVANRCAPPGAPALPAPAVAESTTLTPEPNQPIDSTLEAMRGFRATASIGYAGTSLRDVDGGFTYGLSATYKFHKVLGVTALIGNMSVTATPLGEDEFDATFPRYLVGLHIGHTVFLELLGGSVGVSSTGFSGDSSFSVGASFGGEIGPWRHWAISPSAFVLYPTDDSFIDDEVIYGFMIGPTFRVPRRDE